MSTLYTDAFTYSNGALSTVAANWTTLTSETSITVSSNHLVPSALNADNCNYVNSSGVASVPNDQWAQITLLNVTTADGAFGEGIGVALRCSTSQRTAYRCLAGDVDVSIAKMVNNSYTLIQAQGGLTIVAGDVLYAEAQSNVILIKQNGTQRLSVNDSGITSGRFGVQHSSDTTGTPQLDDFSGGDFAAAGGGTVGYTYRRTLMGVG